jgi:4-hydroxy-3-methylbut-2-enyl diphosphate reductase IspH
LLELSRQQPFHPPDEVSTFKIIKSIKELVVAMLPILDSMQEDWVMVVPSGAAVIASQFGINEAAYQFIERGGTVRVILNDITCPIIEAVQEMMDNSEDLRHFAYEEIIFTIFDKKNLHQCDKCGRYTSCS